MKDLQDVRPAFIDRPGGPRLCPCGLSFLVPEHYGRRSDFARCQRCGLVFSADMPPEEELARWYREEHWIRYSDEQIGMARTNVYVHAWSWLEELSLIPGVLVDVGCGAGTLLALCRDRGWKGMGFDPSIQAAAYARARGLEVHAEAFPPCSLADATADALTFINVLDHLRNPFGALEEAWRVLREGGLLYIRVPNGPFHLAMLSLLSVVRLDYLAVFHLYGFGRASFQYHLPRLGFEILAIRTAPPSQGNAYDWGGRRAALAARLLKLVDQAAYRVLKGLGLTRMAWGPSIEVMARKRRSGPIGPEHRGAR
ncbi:MAG: class I SAM-dependent methyltransferase [Nitrospirae bacterium]|nr:MAG: class I SAM-dependent methyltransferase [Nitrospirota bacterium]